MSVEIKGSNYLGGMPSFEHRIEINGVTIGLSREDFSELTTKLDERIGLDYAKALKIFENWSKGLDTAREFKKELTEIFWNVEEDSDWLLKKTTIDVEKLNEVLEKYSDFLGIE